MKNEVTPERRLQELRTALLREQLTSELREYDSERPARLRGKYDPDFLEWLEAKKQRGFTAIRNGLVFAEKRPPFNAKGKSNKQYNSTVIRPEFRKAIREGKLLAVAEDRSCWIFSIMTNKIQTIRISRSMTAKATLHDPIVHGRRQKPLKRDEYGRAI